MAKKTTKKPASKQPVIQKPAPKSAVVAAPPSLVARVAAIEWGPISDGQAAGFADAFAVLARGDKKSAKALAKVKDLLGEGSDANPIAGLALPFLLELLAAGVTCPRADLLRYVVDAGVHGHRSSIEYTGDLRNRFQARRALARTYEAFASGTPTYRALLGDADAAVRAAAAFALAWVEVPSAVLIEALGREVQSTVRQSLLLALGRRAIEPNAAAALRARLDEATPSAERLCAAIGCSIGAADPRAVDILLEGAEPDTALPWCDGDLRELARRRALALLFGDPPDERPATAPSFTEAQREALRRLLGDETPDDVASFAIALGLPSDDAQLRRFAGLPRHIPQGKHAPIYDAWMTWVEGGDTTPAGTAAEAMLAKVSARDVVDVIELMYYAEQDSSEQIAGFAVPELENAPPPADADDYQQPGSVYRYHVGTIDDCVRRYEALLRAQGYSTWSHGRDDRGDLNQGDVVGWTLEGREIHAGFDQCDDLVRASYEWQYSLVRTFTAAAVARDGAESVLAGLRRVKADNMRRAIGLVRVGWTVADVTGSPTDPVCDELAFGSGAGRHYIYWTARAHLDRLEDARRTRLVVRFLDADEDDVLGWAQFASGPEVVSAAERCVLRGFEARSTSWGSIEGAEQHAERLVPFVGSKLRTLLRKKIAKDDNPTVAVFILGRLGELDAVRPALESEYDLARQAARRVLGEQSKAAPRRR